MRHTRLAAWAAAVALIGGGAAAATLSASASVSSPVRYTKSGAVTVAGHYAHSTDNEFNFTHIESYLGSDDGGTSLEYLPVAPLVTDDNGNPVTDGSPITRLLRSNEPGIIMGGVGVGLCDSAGGEAAGGDAIQLGAVYVGNGKKDIVEVSGQFGPVINTQNFSNDRCQNGLLSTDPGAHIVNGEVLLANVPVGDTVQAGILTDPFHTFFLGSQAFTAGHMVFYATDLVTNDNNNGHLGGFVNGNLVANEADAGAVSDTTESLALTGDPVPLPNFGAYHHVGVSSLARWAHILVNGNNNVTGTETRGAFQSNLDWTDNLVASTSDGTSIGILKLAPSNFGADNTYVGGGVGIVS